jgi:hypothetical protein
MASSEDVAKTDFDAEALQKSILEIPSIMEKQDKIVESMDKFGNVLDSLGKRLDDIEKERKKMEDEDKNKDEDKKDEKEYKQEDEDDEVEINIEDEDDKDKKEDEIMTSKKKKNKSDNFEARLAKIEEAINKSPKVKETKKEDIKKQEEVSSVEPVAPPAANNKELKKSGFTSYLKAAAQEMNEKGNWKAIAQEAKNKNFIAKMESQLNMFKGMEESKKELESIHVNTVAPANRPLKQGGFVHIN